MIKQVPVHKSESGVWMASCSEYTSAARLVAEEAMRALGIDVSDFRKRDAVINAICGPVEGMLEYASKNNSYRDAMVNIVSQMEKMDDQKTTTTGGG